MDFTLVKDAEHPCRVWIEFDDREKALATEADCMAYCILDGNTELVDHFDIEDGVVRYSDGSTRVAMPIDLMMYEILQQYLEEVDTVSKLTMINVNTASAEELCEIKGVGPSTANTIVQVREENPFDSPEDFIDRFGLEESQLDLISV